MERNNRQRKGGGKMKYRYLICCITAAVLAGGCVPGTSEKMIQTRQSQTAAEAQDGKAEYETGMGWLSGQNRKGRE